MKLATTLSALFLTPLLCVSVPARASGQQAKEWTWKDAKGNVRSRADLDAILAEHKLWLNSGGKSGYQANLSETNLTGANLRTVDLRRAILTDTDFTNASLTGADMAGARLIGAHLSFSIMAATNLSGADLTAADLANAVLLGADLSGANLDATHLNGATLASAELKGAVFEPVDLPSPRWIALGEGLELMKYRDDPGPLTELRKQFEDGGYRGAERKITCVLNREEAHRDRPVERWFKRLAFDLTCQYGLSPGRPLLIVLALWLLCSGVYAWFMRQPGPSGIYFVGTRLWRGKSNTQGVRIRRRAVRATKKWKIPFLWLREEWRLRRAALFFSLMSAFNIGFRDINFGRWLRMLTKREYDLKAVGWARTVSGFQSLLSVYMIALWVLTYFGRPFG